MDKDQVLQAIGLGAAFAAERGGDRTFESLKSAAEKVRADYAELESLRAMRKRVEGKVNEWRALYDKHAEYGPENRSMYRGWDVCSSELREALGDSHE